jgi:hypothetical protein
MNKKTLVAVAVMIALLFGAVTPSRARASLSTPVLIGGSIAAFLVFIIVGTLLTTHREVPLFLQEMPPDPAARAPQDSVRFGTSCRPSSSAGQPLVCW